MDANANIAIVPDSSAYMMDRLAMLLAHFPSLIELRIHIVPTTTRRGIAMLPQLVSGKALLPLDTLSNLRILEMRSVPIHLTPEIVTALALGWRSLEELHIGGMCCGPRGLHFPTTLYLEDLYPLAQHCPALRSLAVPLAGVGPLAMARAVDAETKAHTCLQELDLLFGAGRMPNAKERMRLSAFVLAVFPNTIEHMQVGDIDVEKELRKFRLLEIAIAESIGFRDHIL
ncbi:hypothetical protein PsYK624_112190 [Phanerochaete sordida]|uniref:Uncharacterized protein n=1 Tax=Phanerochaete sordida TaxID=48140 RepID=A0A9P3GK56_9APHY|nr:hypothetical protein PsYK624_112190 [Phanerochaete sordida]